MSQVRLFIVNNDPERALGVTLGYATTNAPAWCRVVSDAVEILRIPSGAKCIGAWFGPGASAQESAWRERRIVGGIVFLCLKAVAARRRVQKKCPQNAGSFGVGAYAQTCCAWVQGGRQRSRICKCGIAKNRDWGGSSLRRPVAPEDLPVKRWLEADFFCPRAPDAGSAGYCHRAWWVRTGQGRLRLPMRSGACSIKPLFFLGWIFHGPRRRWCFLRQGLEACRYLAEAAAQPWRNS